MENYINWGGLPLRGFYLRVNAKVAHGIAQSRASIVLDAGSICRGDVWVGAALAGRTEGSFLGCMLHLDGGLQVALNLCGGPAKAHDLHWLGVGRFSLSWSTRHAGHAQPEFDGERWPGLTCCLPEHQHSCLQASSHMGQSEASLSPACTGSLRKGAQSQ